MGKTKKNKGLFQAGVTNVTAEEPLRTHMVRVGPVYYHRRVVPLNLQAYFLTASGAPRTEFKTSLQTKDRREADRRLEIEDIKITRLFDEARRKLEAGVPPEQTDSARRERNRIEREQFEAWEAHNRSELEADLETEAEDEALIESLNKPTNELSPAERLIKRNLPSSAFDRPVLKAAKEKKFKADGPKGAEKVARDFKTGQLSKSYPTFEALFDRYKTRNKPAPATIKSWQRVMERIAVFLKHNDASRLTRQDLIRWRDTLLNEQGLAHKTVSETYLSAIKAVLSVGVEYELIPENVATGISMPPNRQRATEKKRGLTPTEVSLILKATTAPQPKRLLPTYVLARRWIPWICAYTGARVNEITQLREKDIFQIDGVWCIHITPEAGNVKTHEDRIAPLHEHLIAMGLPTLSGQSDKPLFYDPSKGKGGSAANPHHKNVGDHLVRWVRSLGVTDENVQPNHGWRHLMKTRGREAAMDGGALDKIMGHAPATEGAKYGTYTPATLKREIDKLPRFEIDPNEAVSG